MKPIKELGSDKVMKDVYERCFFIAKGERDEARRVARKWYKKWYKDVNVWYRKYLALKDEDENERLKDINADMLSDIQEHCASCGLHGSDCTGCPFQYYHKRSR